MNKVIALLLSLLFLSCQTTSYEPLKEGENRVLGDNFSHWDDESCYNDSTLIDVRTWKGKKLMPYNIYRGGKYDISENAYTCYTEYGIAYIWQNFYYYGLTNKTTPVRLQSDSQLDERARKYCEREHDKVAVYQGNIKEWSDKYPSWMFIDVWGGREYFCK